MHRSGSNTRASDEFFKPSLPAAARPSMDGDQLPTYDPESDIGKKEAMNLRFAQKTVHLIPLLLILCAILLWFFSSPHIGIVSQKDSIVARAEQTIVGNHWTNHSSAAARGGVKDLDSAVEQSEKEEHLNRDHRGL